MESHDNPLQYREFRLYVIMRIAITVGLQILNLAISWYIYSLTKDPLTLGLIGLTEAVPAIGLALYAGHIVDMRDKRSVLNVCFAVYTVCCILFLIITLPSVTTHLSVNASVGILYGIIFIGGVSRSFSAPASFSIPPRIIPRHLLPKSSALVSSGWQFGAAIGPALGGFIYSRTNITVIACIIIACLATGLVCSLLLSPKPPFPSDDEDEPAWSRMKIGARYVLRNKILLPAITLDLFSVLFGGAVALLPFFADHILKAGQEGLGYLRAAPSVGSLLILLIMAKHPPVHNTGRTLFWCVAGFGVCMIGFGYSEYFPLSLGLLFLSGVFDGVSVVIRSTLFQLYTPDTMRGRVTAVNSMFITSSNEIGQFESGIAAKLMGTAPSVIVGGAMTLLVVAMTALFSPTLRNTSIDQGSSLES